MSSTRFDWKSVGVSAIYGITNVVRVERSALPCDRFVAEPVPMFPVPLVNRITTVVVADQDARSPMAVGIVASVNEAPSSAAASPNCPAAASASNEISIASRRPSS